MVQHGPKASSSMVQHGPKASSSMVAACFGPRRQGQFFTGARTSARAQGQFLHMEQHGPKASSSILRHVLYVQHVPEQGVKASSSIVKEQVHWPKARSSMVKHGPKASSSMVQHGPKASSSMVAACFGPRRQGQFFTGAGTGSWAQGQFFNMEQHGPNASSPMLQHRQPVQYIFFNSTA
jgi:hypothetical protein